MLKSFRSLREEIARGEAMITLLGIGNTLLKDEGLGVHFIRWFQQRHDFGTKVNIVDGGTLGFLLLDLICQSERLLVVDALQVDEEPGSLFRFTLKDVPPEFHSQGTVHDITFFQVMLNAEMMNKAPQESVIVGVVPEDIKSVGTFVTPTVERTFPAIELQVLKELQRWGISGGAKKVLNS